MFEKCPKENRKHHKDECCHEFFVLGYGKRTHLVQQVQHCKRTDGKHEQIGVFGLRHQNNHQRYGSNRECVGYEFVHATPRQRLLKNRRKSDVAKRLLRLGEGQQADHHHDRCESECHIPSQVLRNDIGHEAAIRHGDTQISANQSTEVYPRVEKRKTGIPPWVIIVIQLPDDGRNIRFEKSRPDDGETDAQEKKLFRIDGHDHTADDHQQPAPEE